ncbi:uncharacterized protein EI90DRAFT_3016696 [Cantharellus anzutake]|uniref:uncharacterized protein n=1 Tax=Cantharellus anzutake TaxID=1750568 RepID=UPI001904D553|nr:uncharacterized protein EI90DRAFT_3016696 [Cantharellus anzutake]KAF8330880.1 hypothetical protein EI90DRAFT_3016696 [Cantharellus anzutake]
MSFQLVRASLSAVLYPSFLIFHTLGSTFAAPTPITRRTLLPQFCSATHFLRGYGQAGKPEDLKEQEHGYKKQLVELVSMLEEGIQKVVTVGHDYGSPLAARFCGYHPDGALGLVLASFPYMPPEDKPVDPDALIKVFRPILG